MSGSFGFRDHFRFFTGDDVVGHGRDPPGKILYKFFVAFVNFMLVRYDICQSIRVFKRDSGYPTMA